MHGSGMHKNKVDKLPAYEYLYFKNAEGVE
jgi:hypothetical protein